MNKKKKNTAQSKYKRRKEYWKQVKLVKSYAEDAKNKIYREILASGKKGILKKEVSERTGADLSTVYRNARKGEEEGLIKIIRVGRTTRYIATDRSFVDTGTVGHLLANRFTTFILGKGIGMIGKPVVVDIPEGMDINPPQPPFPLPFTPEMDIEQAISELSKQIGLYIIYNFIQSMNPDNYSSILRLQYPEYKVKDILKEEKARQMLSDTWIRSTITSHIQSIKSNFRRVLDRYEYTPDEETSEGREKYKELGYYLLDKKDIKKLMDAFDKACQDIPYIHMLEGYRNKLINKEDMDDLKRIVQVRIDHWKSKHEKQKSCGEHEFLEPIIGSSDDDGRRESRLRICKKCGYKRVFKP